MPHRIRNTLACLLIATVWAGEAKPQYRLPPFPQPIPTELLEPDIPLPFKEGTETIQVGAGNRLKVISLAGPMIPDRGRAYWVNNDTILFVGYGPAEFPEQSGLLELPTKDQRPSQSNLYVWKIGHSLVKSIPAISILCHGISKNMTVANVNVKMDGQLHTYSISANKLSDGIRQISNIDGWIDRFSCTNYERLKKRAPHLESSTQNGHPVWFYLAFFDLYLEAPRRAVSIEYKGTGWVAPRVSDLRLIDPNSNNVTILPIPDVGIEAHVGSTGGINYSPHDRSYLLWDARAPGRAIMTPDDREEAPEVAWKAAGCRPGWTLDAERRVTEHCLPADLPLNVFTQTNAGIIGFVRWPGGFKMSADGAVYRIADSKGTRLLDQVLTSTRLEAPLASPDGCRVAATLSPSDKPTARPRLTILDFCAASDGK
ncbi:MAG: hypothetical protein AB7M05_16675 [Alphaproteobacteria bacterium]